MDKEDGPSARKILSDNLKSLKQATPGLDTIEKIVASSSGSLTNGTVGRIHAASHTTDIDTLQALAKVFHLEPWQLLVENLNPKALPQIADAAFVARLRSILQTADAKERKTSPDEATHQLERKKGSKLSPALKNALKKGTGRNAGRKTGGVQKPRTGRRS